jgi:hypothetical protein
MPIVSLSVIIPFDLSVWSVSLKAKIKKAPESSSASWPLRLYRKRASKVGDAL